MCLSTAAGRSPFSRASLGALSLVVAALAAACEPARPVASPGDVPAGDVDELPPAAPAYASAPTADAVLGGPTSIAAERQLVAALAARGDHPVGDGRLAQLARWYAHATARGTPPGATAADAVARRLGYVGSTPWISVFGRRGDAERPLLDEDLRRHVSALPSNVPTSRYGVATIGFGGQEVVAIATDGLEVDLAPIPRHLALNAPLHMTGAVGERFTRAHLAITLPSGAVKTWDATGRDVTADLALAQPGVHRIELLGDGATGPVVVANFPVYVAVDEPPVPPLARHAEPAGPVDAGSVEASMLALLNAARADAKLAPVAKDDALAAVARAHSEDMDAHGFFGHVSPTTGTTEDRLRRAHLLYSAYAENVARAGSASTAHEILMDSPGHRAAMLGADYTHVGIGAVVHPRDVGGPDVFVTLELARESRVTADEIATRVLEATDLARLPHRAPRLVMDDALSRAAKAGALALAAGRDAQAAMSAARSALSATPSRTTCASIIASASADQLTAPAAARDRRAERLGVAAVADGESPDRFNVVVLIQSASKSGLACE